MNVNGLKSFDAAEFLASDLERSMFLNEVIPESDNFPDSLSDVLRSATGKSFAETYPQLDAANLPVSKLNEILGEIGLKVIVLPKDVSSLHNPEVLAKLEEIKERVTQLESRFNQKNMTFGR